MSSVTVGVSPPTTPLGARRVRPWRLSPVRARWVRVEAAVAALARQVDRRLAVEEEYRTVDERLLEEDAGVVHQVARREVVGAVHDDVVLADDPQRVLRVQRLLVRDDLDVRVVGLQRLLGREHLRLADVLVLVEDLALQVREVDEVEVDDADGADAGEGQVESDGRAEGAGADDEHLRVDDLALTDAADLGHDDVPRVARHLLRRQRKARAVVSGWGASGEGRDDG